MIKTEIYRDFKTLKICPELHRDLKVYTAQTGQNIQEFAIKLLRDGLKQLKGGIN